MIKPSDLKIKLEPFKTKRITDINGLSLLIKGGKKGTTYLFQHRVTIANKTYVETLDTKDLVEARKLALIRIQNKDNLNKPKKLQLIDLVNDFIAYYKRRNLKASTYARINYVISAWIIPKANIPIKLITPKLLFETFILKALKENKRTQVKHISSILNQTIELAQCNYPELGIPSVSSMKRLFTMKNTESHFPALKPDEINTICSIKCPLVKKCLIELSLHLLLRPLEMVSIKVSDIDFDNAILNVPVTKTTTDFKVPLSTQALLIIYLVKALKKNKNNNYLFEWGNKHIDSAYVIRTLHRAGLSQVQKAHSFRAIGRTWFEQNGIKYEVAEACLSHKVRDTTFRAYVRTDYLNERREAMQKWSNFITSTIGDNSVLGLIID